MNRAPCFSGFKIRPWTVKAWIWNCDTFLSEYNTLWPGSSLIQHVEGLTLNTRFTYLRIFDLMRNFDLAEWYSNALKSQYKYELHLAEYSNWQCRWITIQTWFSLLVSFDMLTATMPGIPSCLEGMWTRASSSLSLFKLLFVNCSALVLRWVEPHIHSPVLVWQLRKTFPLFRWSFY